MALAALWPVPASAAARQREAALHVALVSHDKHISQRELRLAARALTNQVNQDLRTWWPGAPVLVTVAQSAGHSRWRLTVEALTINADVSGKHGQNRHGVWGTIYPSSGVPWTWSTSHELLEMLEDPSGHVKSNGFQREICDPVDNIGYYIDNVVLSDFVAGLLQARARCPRTLGLPRSAHRADLHTRPTTGAFEDEPASYAQARAGPVGRAGSVDARPALGLRRPPCGMTKGLRRSQRPRRRSTHRPLPGRSRLSSRSRHRPQPTPADRTLLQPREARARPVTIQIAPPVG